MFQNLRMLMLHSEWCWSRFMLGIWNLNAHHLWCIHLRWRWSNVGLEGSEVVILRDLKKLVEKTERCYSFIPLRSFTTLIKFRSCFAHLLPSNPSFLLLLPPEFFVPSYWICFRYLKPNSCKHAPRSFSVDLYLDVTIYVFRLYMVYLAFLLQATI